MSKIVDLFPEIPAQALGKKARKLHDAISMELSEMGLIGDQDKPKRGFKTLCYSLVDVWNQGADSLGSCLRKVFWVAWDETSKWGIEEVITITLAARASGISREMCVTILIEASLEKEVHSWLQRSGLHLVAPMLDVEKKHHLQLLCASDALFYGGNTLIDNVHRASFGKWMTRQQYQDSPGIFEKSLSYGQFNLCISGLSDPASLRQRGELADAIEQLSHKEAFRGDPLNRRAASLRPLMQIMVFNPGLLLTLEGKSHPEIECAIHPVFSELLRPFNLEEDDLAYLWRRALICIYCHSPEHLASIDAGENEVYGDDKQRSIQLFRLVGVDLGRIQEELKTKHSLDVVYDEKRLDSSSHLMAGWAHPLDAFCQLIGGGHRASVPFLKSHAEHGFCLDLPSFIEGRCNIQQCLAQINTTQGYSAWLEQRVKDAPGEVPSPMKIEMLLPELDLERFDLESRASLLTQYARHVFHSFLGKQVETYHPDRLKAQMSFFRLNTDKYRSLIPDFNIELIRSMKQAGVLADEVMEGLNFTGYELAKATRSSEGLDLESLLTKDLGL